MYELSWDRAGIKHATTSKTVQHATVWNNFCCRLLYFLKHRIQYISHCILDITLILQIIIFADSFKVIKSPSSAQSTKW